IGPYQHGAQYLTFGLHIVRVLIGCFGHSDRINGSDYPVMRKDGGSAGKMWITMHADPYTLW
ncbi:MAG: hypothetical protein KDK34_13130, partial [Leptospiraceae bacterium]|nr:hypothetical protein [Leptospiraceae bacterium]